jgi:hypothetical protein
MANPDGITDHDMSKLDIELTLDGKPIDFQTVFSAFERQLGDGSVASSNRPPDGATLAEVLDKLKEAQQEALNVNSHVESIFDDAVTQAGDSAAEYAADHARDNTVESVSQHCPGDDVNYEVLGSLDSAISSLTEYIGPAN